MKQAPIYASMGTNPNEVANPQIIVGQIKNITVRSSDIKPMLSVRLTDGSLHHNVEMINNGSATGYGYIHIPIEIGGFVYCLKTYENQPLVCLGGADKPKDLAIEHGESTAGVDSDRKAYNIRDLFLTNDGNKVNLTHLNGLVLESDKMIRLQLGENAVFRMSRFGRAGDNVLDGSKFIDYLFAYIALLEEKINQHSEWIQNATPQIAAGFSSDAAANTLEATAQANAGNVAFAATLTQKAREETQAANDAISLALTAGVAISETTATAKLDARTALNPYVQTPYQD